MRDLACSDCVISVLLTITPRQTSEISSAEVSAISALSAKGLVPPLRFRA